jgi:hypothetical protein
MKILLPLGLAVLAGTIAAAPAHRSDQQGVQIVRLRSPDPAQVVTFDWTLIGAERVEVPETQRSGSEHFRVRPEGSRMQTPFQFVVPQAEFAAVFRHLDGPTLLLEVLERDASGRFRIEMVSVHEVTLVVRTSEGLRTAGLAGR